MHLLARLIDYRPPGLSTARTVFRWRPRLCFSRPAVIVLICNFHARNKGNPAMKPIAALRAFWQVLTGAELVPAAELHEVQRKLQGQLTAKTVPLPAAPPLAPAPDRFQEGAVFTLLLLQREGRLVDFLQERLDAYSDEQVGAAVRQIHADCGRTLREHFGVVPVLAQAEGSAVELPAAFDPSAVKLTGNVPEQGPYRGTLRHKGWRAAAVKLPERTGKIDPQVVQAAELEI